MKAALGAFLFLTCFSNGVHAKGGDGSNNGGGRIELNAAFAQERLPFFLLMCAMDSSCVEPKMQSLFRSLADQLDSSSAPGLQMDSCTNGMDALPGFKGTNSVQGSLVFCPEYFLDAQGNATLGALGDFVQVLTRAWLLKLKGAQWNDAEWTVVSAGLKESVNRDFVESEIRVNGNRGSLVWLESKNIDGSLKELFLRDEEKFHDLSAQLKRNSPCAQFGMPQGNLIVGRPGWSLFPGMTSGATLILKGRVEGMCESSKRVVGDYRFDVTLEEVGELALRIRSISLSYEALRERQQ